MTHLVAFSFSSPPAIPSASTKLCAPSSSRAAVRRTSPRASTTPSTLSASRCISSAAAAPPASLPPFRCAPAWAAAQRPAIAGATGTPRHRGLPHPEPGTGIPSPDPLRWPIPLPTVARPSPVRPPRASGRLPRLQHDPCSRRSVEPAGPEAPRQGAPQSHRRLQLRCGLGLVRWPQRPAEEILRDRLFLSDLSGPATRPLGRLGAGPVRPALSTARGLLARLPRHPLSGPRRRPGSTLPPAAWQGRHERAGVLCPGERQPGPLLRQCQPDARRSAGRAAALRGILAGTDRVEPAVAVSGLQGPDLCRTLDAESAGHLVRDDPAARGGDSAPPAATAEQRVAEGSHRHAQALPPAHPLRGRARPAPRLRGRDPAVGRNRAGP